MVFRPRKTNGVKMVVFLMFFVSEATPNVTGSFFLGHHFFVIFAVGSKTGSVHFRFTCEAFPVDLFQISLLSTTV